MELPCIVERVTYRRDKFALLACNLDPYSERYNRQLEKDVGPYISKDWKSFTVVVETMSEGDNPEGNNYVFVGEFVNDPKRGKQYKASGYYQEVPTTEKGMKMFLMSLPNIKESRSLAILKTFTLSEIVNILDNDSEKLLCINGINKLRLKAITDSWEESKHKRQLYEWFIECCIPIKLADKAYQIWGNNTRKKLSENPYLLTSLHGIGFLTADIIAHKINKEVNDKFRISSCLEYCLNEDSSSNGNLCTPYSTLKKLVVNTLLDCDNALGKPINPNYEKEIPYIIKDPMNIFTAVKDIKENIIFIYLKHIWEREKFIAEVLYNRSCEKSKYNCSDKDIEEAEANLSFFLGKEIKLDETQKQAIKSAFDNRISVITGGGGTGKSTICRCIYFLARKKKINMNMMSPTGKAAKVLSEKTGGTATTIHRGLEIGPDDVLPKTVITQEILLVDEISMAGVDTMYALMVAVEHNPRTNIIFVGDKNQLPSVSPGNFLTDLIKSGCANIVTLDKIHRQDENSYISLIANDISNGRVTAIPVTASDITWKDLNSDSIDRDIIKFIDNYLKNEKMDDLQILSPMKNGSCGVNKLNEVIQEKMASKNGMTKQILERDFKKFYIGDRVIQTKNNYEKSVFNGDMGVVIDLGEKIKDPSSSDVKEKFILVDFSGEEIYYYSKEIEELMVAWVITVHKFQGSQSKNIVMVMSSEASIMMNKELVYTGFTRAEKHLYVFGHDSMYRLAPNKSSIKRRFTNLNNIIKELSSKEKILRCV